MKTETYELADGIYRFSTYVPEGDFTFNQFLVDADEPLLFHTGPRRMFPLVAAAMAEVTPVERLRWITFGHVEADESGSMNDWLAAAPSATVAHTAIGCIVSVDDLADRPPRPLATGEVLDLGGKRVRHISTPHVPHGWDAGIIFEETTGTLFTGDLFTATGAHVPAHHRRRGRPRRRRRGHLRGDVAHARDGADDRVARRARPRAARVDARPGLRGRPRGRAARPRR